MKIASIIVTFYPTEEIVKLVFLLQKNTHVFLINNSEEVLDVIRKIKRDFKSRITIVENKKNIGLAPAQNIGIRLGLKENFDFFLFFDDDSMVDDGYVLDLINSFKNYKDSHPKEKIGIFASNFYDVNLGRETNFGVLTKNSYQTKTFWQNNEKYLKVSFVVSSGMLIPAKTFLKLGLFRSSFFIDHIDTEYCLRILKANLSIIVTKKPYLSHTVGSRKEYKILGMSFKPTFNSAQRKYYVARNGIQLVKEYGRKFPGFARIFYKKFIHDLVGIIFFEDQKQAKLRATFKGLRDGKRIYGGNK
ncbi:MAG: glycosyltransferase [Streptococcaceae bacterium]|jgi:rhamnosyltransferase|nr:glycosyltransferase [Streptococcaceae bacterium]